MIGASLLRMNLVLLIPVIVASLLRMNPVLIAIFARLVDEDQSDSFVDG